MIAQQLRQRWRRRWQQWVGRRIPAGPRLTLCHRNLFIFPTRAGAMLGLLLVALMLAAINYQNAMVFALAFLLASTFTIGIAHTYRNLAGLTLVAGTPAPVFAGQHACWPITLSRPDKRPRHAIELGFSNGPSAEAELSTAAHGRLEVCAAVHERGWVHPGRLQCASRFPLGWLRVWTWMDLGRPVLVYPRPRVRALPDPAGGAAELEGREGPAGSEDFYALRAYQRGDPRQHVDWKAYARRDEMLVKSFVDPKARELWLDWNALAGEPPEARLRDLCGWVLVCDRQGYRFGLRLPGATIALDAGPKHRDQCLRALALYRVDQGSAA